MKRRERFEAKAIGAIVDEDADRSRAARDRGGFGGETVVHETPLEVEPGGGALERLAIVRLSVEDDSLDHADSVLM
jgi:hypothetical protein